MNLIGNRRCPKCQTKVDWKRIYIKSGWLAARWPCASCGTVLRFDPRRRGPFAVAVIILSGLLLYMGSRYIVPFLITVAILSLVDGVMIAEGGNQEKTDAEPEAGGYRR